MKRFALILSITTLIMAGCRSETGDDNAPLTGPHVAIELTDANFDEIVQSSSERSCPFCAASVFGV